MTNSSFEVVFQLNLESRSIHAFLNPKAAVDQLIFSFQKKQLTEDEAEIEADSTDLLDIIQNLNFRSNFQSYYLP